MQTSIPSIQKLESQLPCQGLWKRIPLNVFLFIALLALLNSCATGPAKKYQPTFEPQVLSSDVYYEENGKSYKLKSEIYVIDQKTVRIDVRTQLDLPIASLLMSDKKLEYVLYRSKKYFTGRPGPGVLDPIIPMDLSAEDLVGVVVERPTENQKCEYQDQNLLRCYGRSGTAPYTVSWSKRSDSHLWSGKATKMTIELPQRKISLKFYFTDWEKNPPQMGKISKLTIPADFHR